jgi:dipicolinate synthase subunit A
MLTGCHLAFVGGDARQIEVIKKCHELDATITLIGYNQWKSQFPGLKKVNPDQHTFTTVDALILPIVGPNDDGRVESIFADQPIILKKEWLQALPQHAVVYTGMATSYLKEIVEQCHLRLVQLLDRDDVAIYNSIPTVEGALMMAIQNTDFTLHGSRCVVLGLGRVGMTLARVLHQLGAKVSVGARQKKDLARAYEMGLFPFHIDDLKNHVDDCDILFNTIPALVVSAGVIIRLPAHALIIDLASHPGGVDFRFAEKRGIKALLAPSLPGIVAPKTAGQILANVLTQQLFEERNSRGERE